MQMSATEAGVIGHLQAVDGTRGVDPGEFNDKTPDESASGTVYARTSLFSYNPQDKRLNFSPVKV